MQEVVRLPKIVRGRLPHHYKLSFSVLGFELSIGLNGESKAITAKNPQRCRGGRPHLRGPVS
jgi:hypothetical protein